MGWVELGPADAGEIYDVVSAIEAADDSPLRTSLEEIERFFDPALAWRAIGVRASDSSLLAVGMARIVRSGGEVRLFGGVHPDARGEGIGKLLAAEQVKSARAIGGSSAIVHVDGANAGLAELLAREGFELSHEYVQLRKSVASFPRFDVPTHMKIVPLTEDLDGDVLRFYNAVQTKSGGEPSARGDWQAEHAAIDRTWSFVALDVRGDRPRVAAYVVCERYDEEWEALGWSEGYLAEVVLGEEHRGINLVSVLLRQTIDAVKEAGVSYVGVDVPEGDYLLSTFLDRGFERMGVTRVYVNRF